MQAEETVPDRTEIRKLKWFGPFDENVRREMASQNSLMDPSGKKE
jgi:hypothetical protein